MQSKFLAIGNTVLGQGGQPLNLDSSALGQLKLWETNQKKWQVPFAGMYLTPSVLKESGFKRSDTGGIDPLKFKKVYIYKLSRLGQDYEPHDYPVLVGKDDKGYAVLDIRFTDEGQWLEAISKHCKYLHELQNCLYWCHDIDLVYPPALDGRHVNLTPNES